MHATHSATNLSLVHPFPFFREGVQEPSERRAHERLTISALAWLKQVGLKYGPTVSLIDLSVGGAQIEATAYRLQPGTTVVVEIAGREGQVAIPSRIVRCHLAGVAPFAIYRAALEFKRPFALPEATRAGCFAIEADANPVHEHARLTATLRRLAEAKGVGPSSAGLSSVGEASLSATLAIIGSPSGRRAGAAFSSELGRLLRAVNRSVEASESTDKLVADVAERLRRTMPARSIRLVDTAALAAPYDRESIGFDVPSADGTAGKLLAEFPRGCGPEEPHVLLLKAASHIVALVKDVHDGRRPPSEPVQDPAPIDYAGWHRLVVRYRDGRMLKGYGRDFLPAKGQVHIASVPNSPPSSQITVHLAHLKAVFFVHDFDGLSPAAAAIDTVNAKGRPIIVTFLDGEVLTGTTLSYTAEGPGFFVSPTDIKTNNLRIFVVNSAVRQVQFR